MAGDASTVTNKNTISLAGKIQQDYLEKITQHY